MQYILTQEEYDKLSVRDHTKVVLNKKVLQEFCTMVSNTTPINRSWDKDDKSPWGCVLDENGNGHGYCDDCPAENICPYENKEFSK